MIKWIVGLFGLAIVLAALRFSAASPAGKGFVVVKPVAVATCRVGGANARDDEMLFGMTGVITGAMDANGNYPARTCYKFDVLLNRDDILINSAAAEKWERSITHCVVAPKADVVAAPNVKAYPPKLVLPRGSWLWVTGTDGDYFKVGLPDGTSGYVRKPSLRELRGWNYEDEAGNSRRVVEDAMSYLGTPYRWGGKTPDGIDCSGLTSMAFLMNGLAIYRNSRPAPGYPVALMDVLPGPDGKFSLESLRDVVPGDIIYWEGHTGLYIGDGMYIHANGTSFDTRINSLVEGMDGYRDDLADPDKIFAWGTPFPPEPDKLTVKRFAARPDAENKRKYRFYARLDGFAPTSATLYPEGMGEGKPAIAVADPRRMLYDKPDSLHADVPSYVYDAPGEYRPAVVFVNDKGWRPQGKDIVSEAAVMPAAVVVE